MATNGRSGLGDHERRRRRAGRCEMSFVLRSTSSSPLLSTAHTHTRTQIQARPIELEPPFQPLQPTFLPGPSQAPPRAAASAGQAVSRTILTNRTTLLSPTAIPCTTPTLLHPLAPTNPSTRIFPSARTTLQKSFLKRTLPSLLRRTRD